MGGESSGYDIGHFPRLGRHLIFSGDQIEVVEDSAIRHLSLDDFMVTDGNEGDGA